MSKDWEGLRNEVEAALRQELSGLIDGSIDDLNGPVRDAANRLVVAVRRGPAGEKLVAEIRDELALRLLEKQIKAKQSLNGVFDVVLGVGMNLLFKGALGGLAAVKAV